MFPLLSVSTENFDPSLRDEDGVLGLGGSAVVHRHRRPAVLEYPHPPVPLTHH